MDISSVSSAAAWSRNTAKADSYGDLKASLKGAFPNLSVAIGELPGDDKEQEKLAMAGKLAGLTIHPAAADRMQSDAAFRDKVIAGVKADQAANPVGKTIQIDSQRSAEIVGHGTVVEKDGTINSWTLTKTTTTTTDNDKVDGKAKKKNLLEAMLEKLKEQREKDKIAKERYEAALQEADQMRAAGKSDEEVAAKLREAYLATLSKGDEPSVGVETTV